MQGYSADTSRMLVATTFSFFDVTVTFPSGVATDSMALQYTRQVLQMQWLHLIIYPYLHPILFATH